jgi:hypothetical protein
MASKHSVCLFGAELSPVKTLSGGALFPAEEPVCRKGVLALPWEGAGSGGGMKGRIAEDEFHAYLDGALDPARALAVASHLAAHPSDAARAEAYRAQRDRLHALLDHVLSQPVPSRLAAVLRRHERRATWLRRAWAVAAVVMAVAALGLAGRALQDRFSLFDRVLSAPARGGFSRI